MRQIFTRGGRPDDVQPTETKNKGTKIGEAFLVVLVKTMATRSQSENKEA